MRYGICALEKGWKAASWVPLMVLAMGLPAPAQERADLAIHYQGHLKLGGQPVNGTYEVRFRLYDAETGGQQIGKDMLSESLLIDGNFSAGLAVEWGELTSLTDDLCVQFPECCLPNPPPECWAIWGTNWVDIALKPIGGDDYIQLEPRQLITAAPFSVLAAEAGALSLPHLSPASTDETAFAITQSGGAGAASFDTTNPGNIKPTLHVGTDALGPALLIDGPPPMPGNPEPLLKVTATGRPAAVFGKPEPVPECLQPVVQSISGSLGPAGEFDVTNSASGAAALLATHNGTGPAIHALPTGSGLAGLFEGDVLVSGDLAKEYGPEAFYPAAPIGYAYVLSTGAVFTGTPNVTSVWNNALLRYEITIEGEDYSNGQYTTLVTVVDVSAPQMATVSSLGGTLVVYIWNLSGNKIQSDFQLVMFKNEPHPAS